MKAKTPHFLQRFFARFYSKSVPEPRVNKIEVGNEFVRSPKPAETEQLNSNEAIAKFVSMAGTLPQSPNAVLRAFQKAYPLIEVWQESNGKATKGVFPWPDTRALDTLSLPHVDGPLFARCAARNLPTFGTDDELYSRLVNWEVQQYMDYLLAHLSDTRIDALAPLLSSKPPSKTAQEWARKVARGVVRGHASFVPPHEPPPQ